MKTEPLGGWQTWIPAGDYVSGMLAGLNDNNRVPICSEVLWSMVMLADHDNQIDSCLIKNC